jgi:hypothetical protein
MQRSHSDTELYTKPNLVSELRSEFSNITLEEAEDIKKKADDLLEAFYKIYLAHVKPQTKLVSLDTASRPRKLEPIKAPKLTLKNAYRMLKFIWEFGETPGHQIERKYKEQEKRDIEFAKKSLSRQTITTGRRKALMYGSGKVKVSFKKAAKKSAKKSSKKTAKKRSAKKW